MTELQSPPLPLGRSRVISTLESELRQSVHAQTIARELYAALQAQVLGVIDATPFDQTPAHLRDACQWFAEGAIGLLSTVRRAEADAAATVALRHVILEAKKTVERDATVRDEHRLVHNNAVNALMSILLARTSAAPIVQAFLDRLVAPSAGQPSSHFVRDERRLELLQWLGELGRRIVTAPATSHPEDGYAFHEQLSALSEALSGAFVVRTPREVDDYGYSCLACFAVDGHEPDCPVEAIDRLSRRGEVK